MALEVPPPLPHTPPGSKHRPLDHDKQGANRPDRIGKKEKGCCCKKKKFKYQDTAICFCGVEHQSLKEPCWVPLSDGRPTYGLHISTGQSASEAHLATAEAAILSPRMGSRLLKRAVSLLLFLRRNVANK